MRLHRVRKRIDSEIIIVMVSMDALRASQRTKLSVCSILQLPTTNSLVASTGGRVDFAGQVRVRSQLLRLFKAR
jgi:hypothetical protein